MHVTRDCAVAVWVLALASSSGIINKSGGGKNVDSTDHATHEKSTVNKLRSVNNSVGGSAPVKTLGSLIGSLYFF